jgi:hypothetical protein
VALLLVVPSVIAQYDPCQSNNDCSQGYYCIGGFCLEPCNDDADCEVGICQQNGYCGGPVCGNGNVENPETCDDGGLCSDNSAQCFTFDLSACADPFSASCIPQNGDGCDAQCQLEEAECGNGNLDIGEECDPGDPGVACDAGSTCNSECSCDKEANFVLFDLALGHNMLFSKVMDLLHIIKESLFQLEIKTVEIQLTDFECDQQPVSFWIPSDISPYGKLNEINALIELLIHAIEIDPAAFGSPDTFAARALLDDAECLMNPLQTDPPEFRNAFNCKCLAYKELLGVSDSTVVCNDCTD